MGLFGEVDETGAVEALGVVNAQVTGPDHVGGLIGYNWGIASNSYSTGAMAGEWDVGGLVACNDGTLSNSYSTGSVTGGCPLVLWWERILGLLATRIPLVQLLEGGKLEAWWGSMLAA